ncbi:hypothetical protein SNOG_10307 [Parastagonospora nodorum SN15]|uniref:Uncharacterized protein n=1 Tax=Phaeosphaeria nodorum (strain SN15 / ATCC MYA-4574 / FGSC 10173) TaxID=321614 RepID=Q0UD57_PHANO|nr:hypothetical protein SNOG_10307 [Parastagonospora nodorum SN15]EAT82642.1 hypothetical protein SNOG_10307 [Parastagonospora nodorum SN15]
MSEVKTRTRICYRVEIESLEQSKWLAHDLNIIGKRELAFLAQRPCKNSMAGPLRLNMIIAICIESYYQP